MALCTVGRGRVFGHIGAPCVSSTRARGHGLVYTTPMSALLCFAVRARKHYRRHSRERTSANPHPRTPLATRTRALSGFGEAAPFFHFSLSPVPGTSVFARLLQDSFDGYQRRPVFDFSSFELRCSTRNSLHLQESINSFGFKHGSPLSQLSLW